MATALSQNTLKEIQRKAEAGIKMDVVTPEKQKLYDQFQAQATDRIKNMAQNGQALNAPNEWKNNIYNQYAKNGSTENPSDYLQKKQNGVNSIYDQMKEAQLAAARAAREKAIGNINYQKSLVAPQYQASRNQADVVNAQNVQKLREMMAANGLQSSGENVTASVGLQSARQKSLNDLNLQEQETLNDYDRQIADLNNPADEQALIANIEAQRAQALYDAGNKAEEFQYQKDRDKVSDSQWQQSFDFQKAQFKSEEEWRKYTFNNMSASEKAQLEWAKKQYGEDAAWRMYELNYNGNIALSQNQANIDYYKSGFNTTQGGGGTSVQGSTSAGTKSFQNNMAQAVKMGVDSSWVPLLTEIVKRESSFNPTAKNPKSTAYGYGQFLKSTRATYEKKTGLNYGNPVHQLVMMAQYVKDRYGTPQKALAFWNKNKYY